jgi:hypothetical protein
MNKFTSMGVFDDWFLDINILISLINKYMFALKLL